MPPTTEECGPDTSHQAGTTMTITQWWNKFHFSGRVIMCSVLFGLGLILVGGLVFAINMDDEDSSNSNTDKATDQIITKPPSKYVGPVIMGIGCFIVIVGVTMCLFETHVFRKRTGDARPLITEKSDPDEKNSETVPVPGSSHSHKSHRHGARKTGVSPRKSKSRHGKSHSKERNQIKSPSPPISIDKAKAYMTSSEERFLTPPSVLHEDVATNQKSPQTADNSSSSALMKSFTSSGHTWNQSTEFLTPSTSFRDTSISMENSIEVDEKQQEANFKNNIEYMTPFTVEEDRIQKLLTRVQNDQKEQAKKEMELKMSEDNLCAVKEKDLRDLSDVSVDEVKADASISDSVDNKYVVTNDITPQDTSDFKNAKAESKDIDKCAEKIDTAENHSTSHRSNSVGESNFAGNEEEKKTTDVIADLNKNENAFMQVDEREAISSINDSASFLSENKLTSDLHLNTDIADNKINSNDLENSTSSDETVVSPDNFTRKSKTEENEESTSGEKSSNHSKVITISESLGDALDCKSIDQNVQSSVTKDDDDDDLRDCSHGESYQIDKHSETTP